MVVRFLWVGLVLAACSEDPELFIELRTDFVPEAEFVRVQTRIETRDGLVLERDSFGGFDDDFIRGQRVAEFVDLPLGMHLVSVELFSPWGASLSSRRIALDFRASRGVTVVMTRTCAFTDCPGPGDREDATECFGGRCVTPQCSPENPDACGAPACETDGECGMAASCARSLCDEGVCLVATVPGACRSTEWCDPEVGCTPRMALPDASLPDGGGGCSGDGGCDDGFECTEDRCDEGTCRHTPDDSLCTEGAEGMCIDGFGCQYAGCTPASCVPETPCQRARCEGSECVLEDACAPGMCCGDVCVAAGCDDGDACTDDSCGASGCVHTPNSGPCSDGVFCNGPDTCASGACTVHAGPPCPGMSVCDEAGDTCTGCGDDSSCPMDEVGPYSGCSFGDGCSESGTQTRTRTSYDCVGGTCVTSMRMESAACTRETDGLGCGATTFGAWGACGGFSGACDESGTWMRTRTERQCTSGACRDASSSETDACSRDTDGIMCSATSYGSWSACGGFSNVCDESGTQTRTRTDHTCVAATCSPIGTIESGGCSRTTGGVSCGSPTYTAWSACGGFSDECDETGTQTRTRTDPICSGGACGSVDTVESQSCSRTTGGAACGSPTYTAWSACGGFGSDCDESGTQSRTRTEYTCGSGTCNPTTTTMETMGCTRDTDGSFCDGGCSSCPPLGRCCEPGWGSCVSGSCNITHGGICVCSSCACP